MVQSKAATVDAYIAEAPPDRRPALERVRDLARSTLTGAEEKMTYGMPTYDLGGGNGFAFASQKQYLALYIVNQAAVAKNAAALKGLDMGKSCLRYRRPDQIDFALLEQLLKDTRDIPAGPAC